MLEMYGMVRKNTAGRTALSGLFIALTVIILYAESLFPTGRLALYAVSSFIASVVVVESGIKAGWLFYTAASVLSLIIIPDKIGIIPYIFFFGIYPLVKLYIEKVRNIIIEYIIKFVYFNASIAAALLLLRLLFEFTPVVSMSLWILIPGLQVVFFIYDYVFSRFIWYYTSRFRSI